jgi:hypothetical protein
MELTKLLISGANASVAVFVVSSTLGVGLLLCGLAAGAPFLLKLADLAKGNILFAVGRRQHAAGVSPDATAA